MCKEIFMYKHEEISTVSIYLFLIFGVFILSFMFAVLGTVSFTSEYYYR